MDNLKDIISDGALTTYEKAKLVHKLERDLCKNNLFYLAKEVLGYKDLSEDYHKPIADALSYYKNDWQFHLHPRGHFKSTLITVAESIQQILNDPDITILITNAVLSNAASFLKELKSHFIYNEKFRALFPEFATKSTSDEGNNEAFTVLPRKNKWIREATVEISGIDKSVVSRHYNIIKFDDVVNNINSSTVEQRQKVIDAFKEYLSLLNPGGIIRVIGTRWHYYDLYGYILEEIKQARKKNDIVLYKMFRTSCYKGEDSQGKKISSFPEKFSLEYLEQLKKMQGTHIFSCQYLNDPQPEEERPFSRKDIKLIKDIFSEKDTSIFKFCSTDPSVSELEGSDPSVILTIAVNSSKQIFIERIDRQWVNPDQFINLCLNTSKEIRPLRFGFETTAFQKVFKFFLEKEAKQRGVRIPIEEINRSTRISKVERIKRIQPYLKAGQIYLVCDPDNLSETDLAFFDELDEFPYSKHDDILDALADVLELIKYPSERIKKELNFESTTSSPYRTGYRFKVSSRPRINRYS